MRVVRSSLALVLMGFVCAACDGLSIETARRTAADTDTVEETGGSETDAGDDTALDTGAEDTAVDTATDTAADTAVDTAPDTAADTAPDTSVGAANRCGGDAPLTYRGVAAGPGDSCGLCGDGQLFCSGTNDLTCAGASQPNDCGGCGLLTGEVGASCGLCDDGVWACGGGSSDCVGDRPPNGCGGCTALPLEPGTECPLVGGDAGVAVCAGRELSRCASVGTNGCGGTAALTLPVGITGVEPRPGVVYEAGCRRGVLLCDGATLVAVDLEGGNDCGGCEPLLGEPGASCDACGGVWVCDVEGGLRCNGGGRNACGGCELLAAEPGSACNEGGTAGAVICIGSEETGCVPPGATNDCGGLGTLSGDPLGTACGGCSDGVVACDGTDPLRRRTACSGASEQNACGGCGILDATVGSACGTCGTGDYACEGTSLVCSNDGGGAAANICGGCATLAANPGDPCGRCGSWACDAAVTGRLACNEPVGGCASIAACGNGTVETGESCDDGNRVTEACAYAALSCTVCDASCQSVAGATAYCGDGILDAAEVCDEGASNGGGSCSVACTCATGYHLEGGVCLSDTGSFVAVCGNGAVESGESCDDGNRLPNDGCDINCQLPATGLCSVCTSDAGCPLRGGLCLALDNGDFCSVGCGTGCPSGFSCQIVTSVDGFSGRQCLTATNTCGILNCPDVDVDRICDARDICLLGDDRLDIDGDGIPDACDIPIEVCTNGTDDDLDGVTDCADTDCASIVPCVPATETSCTDRIDNDIDGLQDCVDPDCTANAACGTLLDGTCGAAFRIDDAGTFFGDTTGSDNTSAGISCTGGTGPDEAWNMLLPRAGTVCIDTIGSTIDTVLYLRDTCPGTSDLACNDDTAGLGNASRIQFFADADTRYFINVDSHTAPGPYILRVRYGSCTSLPAPELCADRTDNDADGAIDCADSDCRNDPSCIAGVVETICADGRDNDGDGTIDCADLDCFGLPDCSENCNDGIDNDHNGDFDCYDSVCLTDARCNFSATSGGICETPFLVEPINPTNSWSFSTVGGFDQTTISCGGGTVAGPDAVFAFQPSDTLPATYCFDTTGSSYDTAVEARTRCTDITTTVRCEDDTGGVQQTRFSLNTTPGVYYYLIVSGYNGASGNLSMAVSSGPCR